MSNLISELLQHAGFVVVKNRRLSYKSEWLPGIDFTLIGTEDLKICHDFLELAFSYKKNEREILFVNFLAGMWFDYEQPSFVFFTNLLEFEKNKTELLNKNLSWKEIVSLCSCYVIFKGVEENVIWLGKSSNINFPPFPRSD